MNFGWLGNGSLFQEVTVSATARRADLEYWLRREGIGSGQLYVRVYPPLKNAPFAPQAAVL
jgi:hypothetical protein